MGLDMVRGIERGNYTPKDLSVSKVKEGSQERRTDQIRTSIIKGPRKATGEFTTPVSNAMLTDAIEKLKNAGEVFNRRLDFRIDEETKRIIVKVIDTKTDKVIKEIPPEQLVHLAAKIQEMVGLLVDEER